MTLSPEEVVLRKQIEKIWRETYGYAPDAPVELVMSDKEWEMDIALLKAEPAIGEQQ